MRGVLLAVKIMMQKLSSSEATLDSHFPSSADAASTESPFPSSTDSAGVDGGALSTLFAHGSEVVLEVPSPFCLDSIAEAPAIAGLLQHSGGGGGSEPAMLRLVMPAGAIGAVIGKGGDIIKCISEVGGGGEGISTGRGGGHQGECCRCEHFRALHHPELEYPTVNPHLSVLV